MIKFKDPSWTEEYLMDMHCLGVILQLAKLNGWNVTWFKVTSGIKSIGDFKAESNEVGTIQFKFVGKLQIKFWIIFTKDI